MVKIIFPLLLCCIACGRRVPGPDKQGAGMLQGAISGAGSGAVYGAQLGLTTAHAAAAGAGIGAVAGAVTGAMKDQFESERAALKSEIIGAHRRTQAQEALTEHFKRRLHAHPTRDIFPADWFFFGDEVKLRPEAQALLAEVARLNKERLPFSRLEVAVYTQARDPQSEYARYLSERRSESISNHLIRAGIEPKRIRTRAVVIDVPVLIDPADADPQRYSQAVELTPIDR